MWISVGRAEGGALRIAARTESEDGRGVGDSFVTVQPGASYFRIPFATLEAQVGKAGAYWEDLAREAGIPLTREPLRAALEERRSGK